MTGAATRIQLCGDLTVVWNGVPVDLPGRQGRLLFAYLALSGSRSVRRDELIDALWTDSNGGARSETLLSPPLSRLRKALGTDALSSGSQIRLALPAGAEIDWEDLKQAHASAREALRAGDDAVAWRAARTGAEIAGRGLLAGLEAPWIDERRRELTDIHVELLEAVATAGRRLGGDADLAEAERAAREAVAKAPFRESAWLALMEALHARGNVAEALVTYDKVQTLLREELGTRPSARLLALHERLLREDEAPPPEPEPEPTAPTVPPFSDMPARPVRSQNGHTLVERDRELHQIDTLLDGARAGDGRVALIEGPAGIGKSALLLEARRHAIERGLLGASARASELEREFPFGVVRQLFEPLLADPAERARLLTGAAAAAAPVFETASADDPLSGDVSFAVLHGLYWLTLNASARAPLALALDDLQWSDPSSLRFVAYLSHRLEGLPILVLATVRTGEPPTDAALLADITQDPATAAVRPGPLSGEGVTRIVANRLGPDAAPEFSAAIASVTGGNPLLVGQLLAALEADGVAPTAESVPVVREVGPRAVSRSVLTRLGRLSGETVATARAVAVLGDSAELPAVAKLAELDERSAAVATSALARAELLRPEPPLGFVHPLIREAVYRDLPHAEREFQHARAARVLSDLGAPPDQVSTHLLATPRRGEDWIADTLHQAGISARRRGAAESAVAYLRRALEEPPPPDRRAQLLFDLGMAEGLKNAEDSVAHMREAYASLSEPLARARAGEELGRLLIFAAPPDDAAAFLREAIEEQRDATDPEIVNLRNAMTAARWATWFFGSHDREAEEAMIRARHDPTGEGLGAKMMSSIIACYWWCAGGSVDEVCGRLLPLVSSDELIEKSDGLFAITSANVLAAAGRDEAVGVYERMLADAHRRGSGWSLLSTYLWRGWLLLLRGDIEEAESSLQRSFDESSKWGMADGMPWVTGFFAQTRLERGDIAGARAALSLGVPMFPSLGTAIWFSTRAQLEVLEGNPEAAIATAEEAGAQLPNLVNPAFNPWLAAKAQALMALGRPDEARATAELEVENARLWNAPWVVGRSLRVLGVIEGPEGGDHLREAIELLDRSPAQLERAKARAALGRLLTEQGDRTGARTALAEALELAEQCSADGLAEELRSRMRAAGARPRRTALSGPGSLTTSEREVARLAAEGHSNRAIAEQLFVTPKTVEVHLTNAYRKLGIRSRRELGEALSG